MGIDQQQQRLDKLDNKVDKKVSVVKGKEKQLTKVYITKVDKLQNDIKELPPEKRAEAQNSLLNSLRSIDAKNIETKKARFNQKVDEFLETAKKRREIRQMVEKITEPSWSDLGPGHLIKQLYENLANKGNEVTKKQVNVLASYVSQSGKVATEYREYASYFFEDKKPTLTEDKTLKLFVNGSIVTQILTGKLDKPAEMVKAFKKITENVKNKRAECLQVQSVLNEMALGKAASALAKDRGKVIEIYAVLSEKNGISAKTIQAVLQKVIHSEEFAAIAETGWKSAEDFKTFVIETVLRGGLDGKVDKNEIEKIKGELYIKELYIVKQTLIENKIEANRTKSQGYREDQNAFKLAHTGEDGLIFAYCLPDREISSSTPSDNRGNFKNLMIAETNDSTTKANQTILRAKQAKNDARYLVAIHEMDKAKNLAEMKAIAQDIFRKPYNNLKSQYAGAMGGQTTVFSRVELLQAQSQIERNKSEEKAAIVKNKNLLTGELRYRQMLEGGKPIENEVVKKAVIARKTTRLNVLKDSTERIDSQIAEHVTEVETAISKYGNISLVPPKERLVIANKARMLKEFINISHQYHSQISGINTEVKLLDPEKGLTKEEETNYKYNNIQQKKLYEDLSKFLTGEDETLPDPDISSPEIHALMLGQLQGRVSNKIGSAVDGLVKTSQSMAHFFDVQVKSKTYQQFTGGPVSIMEEGVKKTDAMLQSIVTGRAHLINAKNDLLKSLDSPPPAIKDNPKLLKARRKLIESLIKGIQKIIDVRFSPEQEGEVLKMRAKLRGKIEDAFWDVAKFATVFATTIAASIITGGLLAAGAGRLISVARFGQGAYKIATFTAGNIGVAAASTFVPRLMNEGANEFNIGSEQKVDWSTVGIAKDFGSSFGMSMGFSGAGLLLGEKLAIRTAIKQGGEFTYRELTEAGLTKLGALQKMFNPLEGLGKTKLSKTVLDELKVVGNDFLRETVEEAGQEVGERIDPRLGAFMTLVSATNSPDISLDMNSNILLSLENVGVTFNRDLGRLEYKQSSAKEFGIDLIKNLGEAHNELDMSINEDGSFSMRVKGTEKELIINAPATEAEVAAKIAEEPTYEEVAAKIADEQEIAAMMKEIKSPHLRQKVQKIYDNLFNRGSTISKKSFEWTAKALKASKKGLKATGAYGRRFFKILDAKLMEVGKARDFTSIIQDVYESAVEAAKKPKEEDSKMDDKTAVEDRTSAESVEGKVERETDTKKLDTPPYTTDEQMDIINNIHFAPKDQIIKNVNEYIKDIQEGRESKSPLASVLNRLKEYDPQGYELLIQSDIKRMVENETFIGMITGNREDFTNSNGVQVRVYMGKFIAEGGIGKVHHVAFAVPGSKELEFGAIKKAKTDSEAYIKQEIEDQKLVGSWKSEYLVKALQLGEDKIIYETAEETTDMRMATAKFKPAQYFQLLVQSIDGVQAFHKHNQFHGDIKGANILALNIGVDANGQPIYKAKIIDNSPLPFSRYLSRKGFPHTVELDYDVSTLKNAIKILRNEGKSEKDLSRILAIAYDTKGVQASIKSALDVYGIKLPKDHPLAEIMNDIEEHPNRAGDPRTLESLKIELQKYVAELNKNGKKELEIDKSRIRELEEMATQVDVRDTQVDVRKNSTTDVDE